MTEAALRAARAVDYVGAGTVEMLLAAGGTFYFLEMNTRLQVEHPVTELVTGLDLVREQILVARGAPLSFDAVTPRGHALECRLYSEDPARQFFPATGTVHRLIEPAGPFVRFDSGIAAGSVVGVEYDPLLAKIATWGATREEARTRMLGALDGTVLLGVTTNRDFLRAVVAHPAFAAGETHTGFLDAHLPSWQPAAGAHRAVAALTAALAARTPVAASLSGTDAAAAPSLFASLGPWRAGGTGS
jgi:propionyl-CoA carboxylase alpha chain